MSKKVLTSAILSLCLLLSIGVSGQDGSREDKSIIERYNNAISLYNRGLNEAAYQLLSQLSPLATATKSHLTPLIEDYITLIAIESGYPDGEGHFREFCSRGKNSPLWNRVTLAYANNRFNRGEFKEAIEVYSSINRESVENSTKGEYLFKYGYSHFREGSLTRAKNYFQEGLTLPYSSYTNPSLYYLAHTYYLEQDFLKSAELFGRLTDDYRFTLLSQYYLLESNFMLGNHSYVTEKGEKLYGELEGEYKTKSARLISESFFTLDEPEKAQYYFERYSLYQESLSRGELYYAAILAYTQKKFGEAIELFKQVESQSDSLSQNSDYHLGQCYVETKNKMAALSAFERATFNAFDPIVTEDAMFNYAKLSFDLHSDITPFREYLSNFSPAAEKRNEIQNYIADAYLANRQYSEAIEALKEITSPTPREMVNLQKATFLRGMELVSLGAYREALPIFHNSLQIGEHNRELLNVTKFWLSEAYYRTGSYRESAELALELSREGAPFRESNLYPTSLYNLGYSYFKLGEYKRAEGAFKEYLGEPRGITHYREEATVRLADCLFMLKNYQPALNYYSSLTSRSGPFHQYSGYQRALITGLLGRDEEKVTILANLVNERGGGALYPELVYELARTLIQTNKNREAEAQLTTLLNDYSNSNYYSKALLELGLIELNRGRSSKAIEYYKRIVEERPDSPESEDAMAGLESIYKDRGEANTFLAYIDKLGLSQTKSATERESILFASAERQFLSDNWRGAINSLNSFIKSYPDGAHTAHAWFYLGESYQKVGQPEEALDAYVKVMEMGEGSFAELATLNYSRISYSLENYRQAAQGYSALSRIAKLENNKIEAAIGMANSYLLDRQYRNALLEARKGLKLNLPKESESRLKYVIGKSHYLLKERDQAKEYLQELSQNRVTPEGAEATYLLVSDYFDKGEFIMVEREVYSFAESGSSQSYWLAKCFILLGDTFAERENLEQAEATYQSIIDSYHSNSKDEIVEQVEMRLKRIKEIKEERHEENY